MKQNSIQKKLNEIIQPIYEDYVQIRRYLIEYGFMDRKEDGSAYWIKNKKEGFPMDHKKN